MKISFSQTKEGAQRLRELVPQYPQICLTCSSPRPGIPEPTPHEVEGQGDPTNDFFRERPKIVKVSDPFKARGANRRGEKLRNNEIKQRPQIGPLGRRSVRSAPEVRQDSLADTK